MIHEAIYELNPNIVTIRGDIAYDANENEVAYDLEAAQAKLLEMEAAKESNAQAQIDAKQSALFKLSALGLTDDEIKALVGK